MTVINGDFGGDTSPRRLGDPFFDEALDEQHGEIAIAGLIFRAGDVLLTMDPDAYGEALLAFRQQRDENLRDTIVSTFPFPIAHCFARFLDGWDTQNQRLQFLKDTWEAIISVLFALALGEARERKETVFNSTIRAKDVESKNVAKRLDVVSEICRLLPSLAVAEIVDAESLHRMRTLHRHRSEDFAHLGTLSEAQSEALVSELQPEVSSILRSLEALQDVGLVHYLGRGDGGRETAKVETFIGESSRRNIDRRRQVNPQQKQALVAGGSTEVVAIWHDRALRLSPMICCRESAVGHESQLSFFKERRSATVFNYEVFGTAETYDQESEELRDDLQELKACFAVDDATNTR